MRPVTDLQNSASGIAISFAPLPDSAQLAAIWQDLEGRAAASAFLSWPWTRAWLASLPPRLAPELMLAHSGPALVGAALIVKRSVQRRRFLSVPSWCLHTTGEDEFNSLCIEHNGLLVSATHRDAVWRALLKHFREARHSVAELYLHGIDSDVAALASKMGHGLRETGRQPARHVDLAQVRANPQGLRGLIGHSVRKTLRRTEQALAGAHGPVTIEAAHDAGQGHALLDELRMLHERRWGRHESGGAFATPYFVNFHHSLIDSAFDSGLVQLLRVRAAETTVAVLYNLVWQRVAYAYQSGIDYGLVGKTQSPGMLAHVLAIDHCASQGLLQYDLLAGDSQYKQALTSEATELWWGSVQNRRPGLALESALEIAMRAARRAAASLGRRRREQPQVARQ